jgi:hypothetical protein
MVSKTKYVKVIKGLRAMLASSQDARCTCPKTKCEWHGRCYECVRIHRHAGDHIPNCMQPMLQAHVKEIARVCEMTAEPKPKTPDAYWDHIHKVAPLKKTGKSAQ